MKKIENTVKKLSPKGVKMYHTKNRLIFLGVICLMIVLSIYFFKKDTDILGYFFIMLLYLTIVCFHKYLIRLGRGIRKIVVQELDPIRALEMIEELNEKNLLSQINRSYYYLISGNFEKGEMLLNSINKDRLAKLNHKEIISSFLLTESLFKIIYRKSDSIEQIEKDFRQLNLKNLKLKNKLKKQFEFIKAISDIESGLRNDYFVVSEKKHNLDRLIANYYQAKNELFKGETERACELFQKVAVENDDIYFVREAKRILGELSHDRT